MGRLAMLLKSWLFLSALQGTMAKKPNILFILTDDQDWHMQSMARQPLSPRADRS